MEIKFYHFEKREYKNGKSPIYVVVKLPGKRLRMSTGESCKNWSKVNQKVLGSEEGHKVVNNRLTEIKEFINGLDPADNIKDKFAEFIRGESIQSMQPVKEKSFLDYMEDWIEHQETSVQRKKLKKRASSTINTYDQTYRILSEFEKDEAYPLNFEGMNERFYDAFFDYVTEEKGKSKNTFGKYITKLKTFLNWAYIKGQLVNPEYKKFDVYNEYVGVDFLTKEQLVKLYELNLDDHKEKLLKQFRGKRYTSDDYALKSFERLKVVKDMFLFLCYTSLRYSDFKRLETKHIKGEWIIIPDSQKTDVELYIPFYDDLYIHPAEIASKYRKETGLIFPYISNAEFNRYLKHLNQFLDIDFSLSTKVGRKTFVSYMVFVREMSPEDVRLSTGHKKEESFSRYLGPDLNAVLERNKKKSVFIKAG